MNLREDLQDLQWIQLQHDRAYHSDIWCLPVQARIKHMVLHLAKYSSQMTAAVIQNNFLIYQKNLIDTVIICTSSLNILNTSIYEVLISKFDVKASKLSELPKELSSYTCEPNTHLDNIGVISSIVASLCKAIESTDHFEAYESRKTIIQSLEDLWILSLQELFHINAGVSIQEEIANRLFKVEQKNIHFSNMGNYRDGF